MCKTRDRLGSHRPRGAAANCHLHGALGATVVQRSHRQTHQPEHVTAYGAVQAPARALQFDLAALDVAAPSYHRIRPGDQCIGILVRYERHDESHDAWDALSSSASPRTSGWTLQKAHA